MAPAEITVELAYSPAPRTVELTPLTVAAGTSVWQALQASGLLQTHPDIELNSMTLGIWGRRVAPSHGLREGDRIEVYRGLKVDPKEARRVRYRAQGDRGRVRRKKPEPA